VRVAAALLDCTMDDSSDNAFSFAGHAAAAAGGEQSNSSQSVDTGGSDNSELRTNLPGRALVQPRGRPPMMSAIADADPASSSRRTSTRDLSTPKTPRKRAKPISPTPPSPIHEVTPSAIGSYQRVSIPSSGSDLFTI
jgi:hypothetical protein